MEILEGEGDTAGRQIEYDDEIETPVLRLLDRKSYLKYSLFDNFIFLC